MNCCEFCHSRITKNYPGWEYRETGDYKKICNACFCDNETRKKLKIKTIKSYPNYEKPV